jgi:hypothetical protein
VDSPDSPARICSTGDEEEGASEAEQDDDEELSGDRDDDEEEEEDDDDDEDLSEPFDDDDDDYSPGRGGRHDSDFSIREEDTVLSTLWAFARILMEIRYGYPYPIIRSDMSTKNVIKNGFSLHCHQGGKFWSFLWIHREYS